MIFEALKPMEITTKTLGIVTLKAGDRLEWPAEAVMLLVEKCPGKVRVVDDSAKVQPGVWVEFFSPLFGMVTAKIKSVETDGIWLTNHSVLKGTDEPCRIPVAWIVGTYLERSL